MQAILTDELHGRGLAALQYTRLKIYSVVFWARSDFTPYGSYSVVNGGCERADLATVNRGGENTIHVPTKGLLVCSRNTIVASSLRQLGISLEKGRPESLG